MLEVSPPLLLQRNVICNHGEHECWTGLGFRGPTGKAEPPGACPGSSNRFVGAAGSFSSASTEGAHEALGKARAISRRKKKQRQSPAPPRQCCKYIPIRGILKVSNQFLRACATASPDVSNLQQTHNACCVSQHNIADGATGRLLLFSRWVD